MYTQTYHPSNLLFIEKNKKYQEIPDLTLKGKYGKITHNSESENLTLIDLNRIRLYLCKTAAQNSSYFASTSVDFKLGVFLIQQKKFFTTLVEHTKTIIPDKPIIIFLTGTQVISEHGNISPYFYYEPGSNAVQYGISPEYYKEHTVNQYFLVYSS